MSHKYDSSRQACTKKQKKYLETYKKADPITEHEQPIVPLLIPVIFFINLYDLYYGDLFL